MADLQKKVTKVSVKHPGDMSGYTIIAKLQLWNATDDPLTDSPRFEQNFDEYLKVQVEDKTEEELNKRVELALTEKMQAAIDKYKDEAIAIEKSEVDTMMSNIEGGLTG